MESRFEQQEHRRSDERHKVELESLILNIALLVGHLTSIHF